MEAVSVNPSAKEVSIVSEPEPGLGSPTDVKLRMLEVGICGTDREICSFEYGTPPSGSDHLVIGHESLGEVVEVGSGVTRVRTGDLVVPMVRRGCSHADCVPCRADRQDFCFTGDFKERGIKRAHGFMTRYVVDDEKYMNVVPPELRDVAVLVEPLTIAEKALKQVWEIQQRLPWGCASDGASAGKGACHTALVLGAGPVGFLGALALKNAGFDTHVYSRSAPGSSKPEIVRSFGATFIASEETPLRDLPGRLGNIDLVYEAVGASQLAFEALEVLGTNGVFVFTGVPGRRGPIEVDTDELMRNLVLKNQIVFGTVNASRDVFEAAIRDLGSFVGRWPSAVRGLITGRYPMTAYRDLLLGRPSGIKNVVVLNGAA